MSTSAQVLSIDLLKRLHAVLARFGLDAQSALVSAGSEILHVQARLEERFDYWRQQTHKRQEEVNHAKASLAYARAMSEDGRTGCVEQELALRKAQERLREAEAKVLAVRRWQRDLPEFIKEYEGPARSLSGFLDANLRQALVILDSKVAALEGYVAITSGQEKVPSAPRTSPEPESASPPSSAPEAKEPS